MTRHTPWQLLVCLMAAIGCASSAAAQTPVDDEPPPAPVFSAEEAAAFEPAVDVGAVVRQPAPETPAAPREEPAARPPATGPRAMDSLDLGTTSITGNQELPKVLYIVPWKQSDLGDLVGRPVNTLLDEVLAPVDPEEFERQLGYYGTLHEEHREE